VTLSINDAPAARGEALGPLSGMPGEGLQVGQDSGSAVGDYAAPFVFKGNIASVTIKLTSN
jgi:hypothetical protein